MLSTPESLAFSSVDASSNLFISARWKAGGLDPPSSPPEICINYTNTLKHNIHYVYVNDKQNFRRKKEKKANLDSRHHSKLCKVHIEKVLHYPYAHKGLHLCYQLLLPSLVLGLILLAPLPLQGTLQSIVRKRVQYWYYHKQMHGKENIIYGIAVRYTLLFFVYKKHNFYLNLKNSTTIAL